MAYPYNNFNGYGYNPYNNYQQPQPQYQQQYQQTFQQPMTNQITSNVPQYVSGIEGAKAFIVMPGQVVWLKDSENENVIYVKSADAQGKFTLDAYKMLNLNLDNVGKKEEIKKEPQVDLTTLITKNDFNAFLSVFNESINNLSSKIEKANISRFRTEKTNINK